MWDLRTVKSTVAAAVACLALVGGGALAAPGAATAAAGEGEVTPFGFRADAYGAKLVTGGVEAFNVKDAHAQLVCTRTAGRSTSARSTVSVPDNPLIDVSLSTSETRTYRSGGTHGVRGTSTIGDIVVGGELPGGVRTPRLVIEGLTSTADAFHRGGRFGHAEELDFAGIRLELLDNTVVENLPPELQQLLAPLQQVTDTVFAGTNAVANQVFAVLQDATAPIRIPGLGTISVGRTSGHATRWNAASEATALHIEVTATGERQLLELGRARARIGRETPAGVFRSGSTAMDLHALGEALHFGSVSHKALPCEGTRGRTKTYRVRSASLLAGTVVSLGDVVYTHRGDQDRVGGKGGRGKRRERARGFSSTRIGTVSVPAAQLEIRDVFAKVRVRALEGRRSHRRIETTVGSITAGGQPLAVPAPGSSVELPGGAGVIEHRVVRQSFHGARVTALRIKLFSEQVRIDLGTATGAVYPR